MKTTLSFALFSFLLPLTVFGAAKATLSPLNATDNLQTAVEEIGQEWQDNNISTGTTLVTAGVLSVAPKTAPQLKALGQALFREAFAKRLGEELPKNAKLKTVVLKFNSAREKSICVKLLVGTIAESNAYSPENLDDQKAIRDRSEQLLDILGQGGSVAAVRVTVSVTDDSSGEARKVDAFTYVNVKTKKALVIFTIEGTM